MRTLIFFLLFALIAGQADCQVHSKVETRSKMNQFSSAMNNKISDLQKQIADAKKNKKDPETITGLEDQLKMLKQQVATMDGLKKNVAGMSDKTFNQVNESSTLVPKKDLSRINMLPKKILSEAELFSFIKTVNAGVEKLIPAIERAEALKIYNETKTEYKTTAIIANAASGCWMLGHWEKALFIMGKVCLYDITDADNLNNYAAFLVMTGGEQAAIPILEYLNQRYPENSTIENNLGQAWFGLGEVDKAKKYLGYASQLYQNHPMANITLGQIARAQHDNDRAISLLKASLKETYDPEIEATLKKLGYEIKLADLPSFNYPMQKDPFGIVHIMESMPENYPSRIDDDATVDAINRYRNGVSNVENFLNDEMASLGKKIYDDDNKLYSDKTYQHEYVEPYNNPAYKLARRTVQFFWEQGGGTSPWITHLLLSGLKPPYETNNIVTDLELRNECFEIWETEVLKPLAELAHAMRSRISPVDASCAEIDAATNAYMAQESALRKAGIIRIKDRMREKMDAFDKWTTLNLYSKLDNPPSDERMKDIVDGMSRTIRRKHYKDGQVYEFFKVAKSIVDSQTKRKTACENNSEARVPYDVGADDLAPLIPMSVKCEFSKTINTPIVTYFFDCSIMKDESKKNIKKKNDPVPKGQGHSSSRRSQTRGPLRSSPRGPYSFDDDEEATVGTNYSSGPLTAEEKDPSQFSIEYDLWGNLVGLNLQLNEDHTALKDQSSAETDLDARWSWNAIASPKKGYLNKLVIK